MATYRNISLVVFSGQLRAAHMKPLLQMRAEQRRSHPEGLYTCIQVFSSGKLPSIDVRKGLVDNMREHQSTQLGTAFIIEAQSVGGTAMRTVISAVALSAHAPYRVFDFSTSAVPWLAGLTAQGKIKTTAEELHQALSEVAAHQHAQGLPDGSLVLARS